MNIKNNKGYFYPLLIVSFYFAIQFLTGCGNSMPHRSVAEIGVTVPIYLPFTTFAHSENEMWEYDVEIGDSLRILLPPGDERLSRFGVRKSNLLAEVVKPDGVEGAVVEVYWQYFAKNYRFFQEKKERAEILGEGETEIANSVNKDSLLATAVFEIGDYVYVNAFDVADGMYLYEEWLTEEWEHNEEVNRVVESRFPDGDGPHDGTTLTRGVVTEVYIMNEYGDIGYRVWMLAPDKAYAKTCYWPIPEQGVCLMNW